MADKNKKSQKSKKKQKPAKNSAGKANTSKNADKSSPTSKKVNVLAPPQLSEKEKEKLLKNVTPQVYDIIENTRPQIQQMIDAYYSIPWEVIRTQMEIYQTVARSVARQIIAVRDVQMEVLQSVGKTIIEVNQGVVKSMQVYRQIIETYQSSFEVLIGFVVKISFATQIFREANSKVVYDYDELNAEYDSESQELDTPLKVTKENTYGEATFTEVKKLSLKVSVLDKTLINIERNGKKKVELLEEQNQILKDQNKILIEQNTQLKQKIMSADEVLVGFDSVKWDDGSTKLKIKGKPIPISEGTNEAIILKALFDSRFDNDTIWDRHEMIEYLGEDLSETEIVNACDRINKKVKTIAEIPRFIKIYRKDKAFQLDPSIA